MKLVTTEMLADLKYIDALGEKARELLIRQVDETIEGLVSAIIADEILEELKLENPGGYTGTRARQIYLEETIDSIWDMYVGGGVEQEYDRLIEKGWLPKNFSDSLDDDENLHIDMRELFYRMMKDQLLKAGIDKEIIHSIWS